jgi:hypothetical protein
MIKKYFEYIKEADETQNQSNKFSELTEEVKKMIETTIDNSGGEFKSFVDSFVKSPEDIQVEGFINDSDIYDFYLKWRNDIDEVLNDINFFDEVPTQNNSFGLYEYVINGTKKAFEEIVGRINQ